MVVSPACGGEMFALSYPSERDDVERVLSAVDGVQEVAVGDLRTRKYLQLTVVEKQEGWGKKKYVKMLHGSN